MVDVCARPRRPADGGVHVPAAPVLGRGPRARRLGPDRAVARGRRAGSRTTTTTRPTSATSPSSAAAALFDIGCYTINLSRMLFGAEPATVVARRRQRDPATGVDILTSAILGFARRHGDVHLFDPGRRPDQRVARLRRPRAGSVDRHPVQHPARPADASITVTAGGDPPVAPGHRGPRPSDRPTRTPSRRSAFAAAILDGPPTPTPPEDAVANLRVIERVFAGAGDARRRDADGARLSSRRER